MTPYNQFYLHILLIHLYQINEYELISQIYQIPLNYSKKKGADSISAPLSSLINYFFLSFFSSVFPSSWMKSNQVL